MSPISSSGWRACCRAARSRPRSSSCRSAGCWAAEPARTDAPPTGSTNVRIVSLLPSTTETLLAWGVDVVACTRFCEQPQLRHVGGTKDPDVAGIVALAPDLVVLDREENRREDADELIAAGVRIHVTHVV